MRSYTFGLIINISMTLDIFIIFINVSHYAVFVICSYNKLYRTVLAINFTILSYKVLFVL